MVGLHTCGDLAPSTLRMFTAKPELAAVCSVGCCYHLLSEEFDPARDGKEKEENLKIDSLLVWSSSLSSSIIEKPFVFKMMICNTGCHFIHRQNYLCLVQKFSLYFQST